MAEHPTVIKEGKSDEAIKQWLLGQAVIQEPPVCDENGKELSVPGCPICRVSEHYKWATKAMTVIFHCW